MIELSQKHIILIKELMDCKYPLSSEVLSISLGINPKTLKIYIDESNEYMHKHAGASIISKSGKGIYIKVLDGKKYKKYYQEFNSKYQGNKFLSVRNTRDTIYITRRLLFSTNYITIGQFADELFKTRKSVYENLYSAENLLNQYHIQLQKKPSKGFKISGKESHIRIAIADYFQIDVIDSSNEAYIIDYDEKKDIICSTLADCAIRYNISISEKSLLKLAKIIYISIDRYRNHMHLEDVYQNNEEVESTSEFLCAHDILEKLQFHKIPLDEQKFLAILLISRRYLSDHDYIDIRKHKAIYKLSGDILDDIFDKTEIDFTLYPTFRIELARHLRGMYYRIKYGIEKRSVKVIETKQNNTYFEFAVMASEYISNTWCACISEYEISYLALIFYYQQLLLSKPAQKRVLIISTEGKETAKVISWELMNNWKKYIDSIYIEDVYLLNTLSLDEYDLLVTDIPNLSLKNITCIYVNNYLNNFDYLNLKRYFESHDYSYYIFKSCFSKELYFHDINVETKDEIIQLVSKHIAAYVDNNENIYNTILKRDNLSSLEFGNSTVVLHSYTVFSQQPKIMIVNLNKPILWNKERCRLVIFVLNGKKETVPFETLSLMKNAISNSSFTHSIIHSSSYEEMMMNINHWIDTSLYQDVL